MLSFRLDTSTRRLLPSITPTKKKTPSPAVCLASFMQIAVNLWSVLLIPGWCEELNEHYEKILIQTLNMSYSQTGLIKM